MDLHRIEILLKEVNHVSREYEKIAKLSGENFNIFQTLELGTAEVRLHSAILTELLNTKGSHGQNELFLDLFIKQLATDGFDVNRFDVDSAVAEAEYHSGLIDSENTKGGYIDILITDKNYKHIIIENKIYAGDQPNQLYRYHNFDQTAPLFYLTLYGLKPSKCSTNIDKLPESAYNCISYKDHIINWLESCKKEAVDLPVIRETLTQYINLLKYLTGQTTMNKMANELVNIIVNDENKNTDNLRAFFDILNVTGDVKRKLFSKFTEQLKNMANEKKIKFEYADDFVDNKDAEIKFILGDKYYLCFCFCAKNFDRFVYGIRLSSDECEDEFREKISCNLKDDGLGWGGLWVWVNDFEINLQNWNDVAPWIAIISGTLKDNVEKKVETLIEALNGIDN